MSFAQTVRQVRERQKTVTRRKGWEFLKPGDVVMASVKTMGLKAGEKIEKLGPVRIVSVRRESLRDIADEDIAMEGFPGMSKVQFVQMLGATEDIEMTRIEFEYVEQ